MIICYQACNQQPNEISLTATNLSWERGVKDLAVRRCAVDDMRPLKTLRQNGYLPLGAEGNAVIRRC